MSERKPHGEKASGSLMLPLGLVLFVLVSAIFVVQVKHRTRILHNESNRLLGAHDQLDVEWAQLQLEEAAHSNHARIENKARSQLKMIEPRQPVMVNVIGSAAADETRP